MPIVKVGEQRIKFPDDMSPGQIKAVLDEKFGNRSASQQVVDDMSTSERVLAGIGKSFSDTATGAKQRFAEGSMGIKQIQESGDVGRAVVGAVPVLRDLNRVSGWLGINTPEYIQQLQQEVEETRRRDKALTDTTAGTVGQFIGDVAQMAALPGAGGAAGTAAKVGGAVAQGAGFGFVRPTAEGESAATNAAIGGAASGAGQYVGGKIASGIGKLISPAAKETDKVAQAAAKEGVELDLAQITQTPLAQNIKSRLKKLPATANKQAEIVAKQQSQFNKAVLSKIGVNSDKATEDVIDGAFSSLGKKFDDLVGSTNVKVDDIVLNGLTKISQNVADSVHPEKAKLIERQLSKVLDSVDDKGMLPGTIYRSLRTDLNNIAQSMRRSQDLRDIYPHMLDIVGELDSAVGRQLGGAKQAAWKEARKQYATLNTLVEKNLIDEAGDISGPKMFNAVRNQNKRAFARGAMGDMATLARIGKRLQDKVPDSGTASNAAMQFAMSGGLPTAVGIGSLAAGQDPETAARNAAIAALPVMLQKGIQAAYNNPFITRLLSKQTVGQAAMARALKIIEKETGKLDGPTKRALVQILRNTPASAATAGVMVTQQ